MPEQSRLIQSLQDLGLTRTEAEVYLAVLQEAAKGPVSGYRVAQTMGRDPANLGKTMAALVMRGAVQVVQDKPRLYRPLSPDEFVDNVISMVRSTSDSVREMLRELSPTGASGQPLTLRDQDRVLEKTRRLLLSCDHELQLFASPEVIEALSDQLNRLAAPGTISLRLRSTAACPELIPDLLITQVDKGLSQDMPHPWLQMVVDRQAILMAVFKPDCTLENPCGWWLEDRDFGTLLMASMASAGISAPEMLPEPEILSEPEPAPAPEADPEPAPHPEPEFQSEAAAQAEGIPSPEPESAAATPRIPEQGFQFIVRHEDEKEED